MSKISFLPTTLTEKLFCFSANDLKGKLGKKSYLEEVVNKSTSLAYGESAFKVSFDWNNDVALPGALIVRNEHHREFYLRTITLEDIPNHGKLHFICNSWVYPAHCYQKDRLFFANKVVSYYNLAQVHVVKLLIYDLICC